MSSILNPYLAFEDDAREAMQFYRDIFGGTLTVSTFGEFGHPDGPDADKIMHAQLVTEAGYTLMGADTPRGMTRHPGDNVEVSLSGDDEALRGYFEGLCDGGNVSVPLEKQTWGDEFGMVTDRFGVGWMVNITGPVPSEAAPH